MKKLVSKFDFGIQNYGFVVLYTLVGTLSLVVISPYTISVDGFSYLKSSEVLFSPNFAAQYTWIREPGYPMFIRLLADAGGLSLVFFAQGTLVALGVLATILGVYRVLKIATITWKTFLSATLAIALVGGYSSTILQQSLLIFLFGLLLLVISRINENRKIDWPTGFLISILIGFSTVTAVFMGLAFGLTLLLTLVMCGVINIRLLASYSLISVFSFLIVMVPWSHIKSTYAPAGSPDAIEMGSSSTATAVLNFNPDKEFHEVLLTQLALINLGGELPPVSGLPIANENRIFGTPIYSPDQSCGRFLTSLDPDSLWGQINTDYESRCVHWLPLSALSKVNSITQFLFPLSGLALLVVLILSAQFGKKTRPIVFPAFIITLPYIVMDASISRYGALVIPLGAVLLFELISPKASLLDNYTDLAPPPKAHAQRELGRFRQKT
jgi:hypothetical protein